MNELIEIRARQRTFDGAYSRTALGNLSYALAVLRLFDRRFHRSEHYLHSLSHRLSPAYGSLISDHTVGVLYAALAGFLFLAAFFRARHSRHDFADRHKEVISNRPVVTKTKGQEGARIFGRPFVTAGWIVVAVSAIVAVVEVCLLVLIFYL